MISYIFRCLKCLDMSVVKHMCRRLLCSELSFCLKYSCWVTWQRNGSKIWVTWLYFFGYTSFVEQSSLLRELCFSVFFICNSHKIVGFVKSSGVPPPLPPLLVIRRDLSLPCFCHYSGRSLNLWLNVKASSFIGWVTSYSCKTCSSLLLRCP